MAAIRIIKKYPNRRLYDTEISSYITIEDVRQLILDGESFEVRDAKSGEGLTRSVLHRLLTQEMWTPLASGLYHTNGTRASWQSLAWGGVLVGGDQAMLCRRAAGHLWAIHPDPPETIQILIPDEVRLQDRDCWQFIRTRNLPGPTGSPPRSPLPDTVLDLCLDDPARTSKWIAAALHTRRTTASAISKALATRQRHPNRKLVLAILQDHQEGVHSELERIFRRDVERAHGLPTGARQVQGLRHRTDVEYLGGAVITELDGRLGHEGEGRFRDMDRDNHHAVHGRVTLRYGWADVTEGPCKVARQIAAVLYAHGWQGVLTPCPNCRLMHNAEDRAA